jgi:hypothetical protein
VKNINFDLVKLLQSKLDNCWRLENFYCKDAEDAGGASLITLKQVLDDEKRHVEILKKEIETRIKEGLFY